MLQKLGQGAWGPGFFEQPPRTSEMFNARKKRTEVMKNVFMLNVDVNMRLTLRGVSSRFIYDLFTSIYEN